MAPHRYVAKGPALSVTATLRELGLSKSDASALAKSVEKLVDGVLPRPQKAKAKATKRYSAPMKRKTRNGDRARPAISRAA